MAAAAATAEPRHIGQALLGGWGGLGPWRRSPGVGWTREAASRSVCGRRASRRVGVGMAGGGSQWTPGATEAPIWQLELGAEHMLTNVQHTTHGTKARCAEDIALAHPHVKGQ
eukprot:scaffold130130_cov57-Phaeocystis_antarctica.AAC.2